MVRMTCLFAQERETTPSNEVIASLALTEPGPLGSLTGCSHWVALGQYNS